MSHKDLKIWDCSFLIPVRHTVENRVETSLSMPLKKSRKKIIYQTPWMEGEECKGIVELSLEIPHDLPHFNRD